MFCCRSNKKKKPQERPRTKIKEPPQSFGDNNVIRVESVQRYDEQIVNILQRDLWNMPEWFVLNNMMMSVQFFENYYRDVIRTAHATANKMEKQLNKTLLKDETMECTSPDIVFDKVNKYVRFRPFHGPGKHSSVPLAVKRLFVVSDTIEVVNSMEVPQYTSIDKPAYQVRTEESPRKGFVRLKFIDTNKIPKIYDTSSSTPPHPSSSKSSDSDIYEYSTITELRTPKPLSIVDNARRDTLPRTCFANRRRRRNINDWMVENEDEDLDIDEEEMYESVTYVNAKGFMNYFKNGLFPNSLGKSLGFDEAEISQARAIPGKVFCNLYDEEDNPIPCEVIPAVSIDWPDEQTFEFIMREERPTIIDWRTGLRYKWPTDDMIKELKSLSCVLVPTGFWKKKGQNPDAEIEWEIAFPKAERYIEARMSHSQMRCFLFLLAIHKTFIEPETKQYGLLTEHIRCHMYWECEADYRDWPEHRLGFKLKKVIQNLIVKLAKLKMPDYFIKCKNLFENIPRKYLLVAQGVFQTILEAPLMHFLGAARNIRYTSGKFYPPLDIKELYKVLIQSQGIKLINPIILKSTPPNLKQRRYDNQETQWDHLNQLKKKERYLKKVHHKENLNKEEERRESKDSIDLEWACEKQFNIYKTKAIVQMFINNFIDIAKDSSRLSTKDQALFFLKQAWYLTHLLESTSPGFLAEVDEYREVLEQEEMVVKKVAAKEISDVPPATPLRNSTQQFDYNISQQVRGNLVDLNNLHNSFSNSGSVKIRRLVSVKVDAPGRSQKSDRKSSGEHGSPVGKSISFLEPLRDS